MNDFADSDAPQNPSEQVAISHIVHAARLGNRAAAMALLEEYSFWVEVDEREPEELREYFGQAFRSVLDDDEDIVDALNLRRRQGRPPKPVEEIENDLWVGEAVAVLMDRESMTYEDATFDLSERWGRSRRNVERAYQKYKQAEKELDSHGFLVDPNFRPRGEESYRDRTMTLARHLEIADALDKHSTTWPDALDFDNEARKHTVEELDSSDQEIDEAIQTLRDWLLSLFQPSH